MIYLRPHHGLCIEFFEGKGYSPEFTEHMAGLIVSLKEDDSVTVKLVTTEDNVCSKCPNNIPEKGCTTTEKVLRYDNAVLAFTGLKEGSILSYHNFRKIVIERILTANNLASVCDDCAWASICSKAYIKQYFTNHENNKGKA